MYAHSSWSVQTMGFPIWWSLIKDSVLTISETQCRFIMSASRMDSCDEMSQAVASPEKRVSVISVLLFETKYLWYADRIISFWTASLVSPKVSVFNWFFLLNFEILKILHFFVLCNASISRFLAIAAPPDDEKVLTTAILILKEVYRFMIFEKLICCSSAKNICLVIHFVFIVNLVWYERVLAFSIILLDIIPKSTFFKNS